ncbi:MAG: lysophospholipase [Acetobacteraceae bacterium]|nr:lysophospholipase [Acetobacteraceae bacterium]
MAVLVVGRRECREIREAGATQWPAGPADDSVARRAFNRRPMLKPPRPRPLAAALLLLLTGCMGHGAVPLTRWPPPPPVVTSGAFAMPDGARLPYRQWLPDGEPAAVVLALHGMNDSRDAWEIPAADFARAGIAVFAPDQRGFGEAPGRGFWPGDAALVADARTMADTLRRRYPRARLILMGESMGAAVLMCLATGADPPPADGYVLVAPAVWGRAEMNILLRASLWLATGIAPGLELTGAPVRKVASSNRAAIVRLSTDPLTIRRTRVDAVHGLVDLMDAALAAAPRFSAPALFLYGGHDELVPDAATAATWRALPAGERRAFYPNGYHLLLRDLDRARPIGDIEAWIRDPASPLPSGAEPAARQWLGQQD